jgi:sugar (glycoside-pentoside-hexuronide) transporter
VKKQNDYVTGYAERFSYGSYFLGQNLYYTVAATFLLTFYTDVGLSAATVSVILFLSKFWDAVNDPIFGAVMDKMRFKRGKFIPWLRISLPLIAFSTMLIFACPSSLPASIKVVWCFVAYLLWDTSYTLCDAPAFGLVTTMTTNVKERVTLMTFGRYAALAGSALIGYAIPMLRTHIGGWFPFSVVMSAAAFILMLPICLIAKERYGTNAANANAAAASASETSQSQSSEDKQYSIRDMIFYLRHNKYLFIFFGSIVIASIFNVAGSFGMYFARYCLGNESLLGVMSLVMIPAGLLVYVIFPFLCRRFDKFSIYFWASVANVFVSVVSFFVGYDNLVLFLSMRAICAIATTTTALLMFMFTPDCVVYGAYTSGINASGIAFSIQTFTVKLTAALSAGMAGLVLVYIGFIAGENAVQLDGFNGKLWMAYILLPALGVLLSLPVLAMYKLREKDVELMAMEVIKMDTAIREAAAVPNSTT